MPFQFSKNAHFHKPTRNSVITKIVAKAIWSVTFLTVS